MKRETSISVIMSVHNQFNKEELQNSINSILEQSMTDIEFLICDDGSDEVTSGYIRETAGMDSRIHIVINDKNMGLAASLNRCIKLSQGRYIARMDADDISAPERLQTQYEFMENNPQYAWCGCNARLYDANGIWGERVMPEEPDKKDFLKYSPYIHPTVMFRRDILVKEKGYNAASVTRRCEDYELFMRLTKDGYKGYNIPEFMFVYKEDKCSYKRRTFKNRINESKVRHRGFKQMGIPFFKRVIYGNRPLMAGFLPSGIISWWKRKESGFKNERDNPEQDKLLREAISK